MSYKWCPQLGLRVFCLGELTVASGEGKGNRRSFAFSEEAIAKLLFKLKEWVDIGIEAAKAEEAAKAIVSPQTPLPPSTFNPPAISLRELTNAMREVNTDLGFLARRRPRLQKSGISPGKTGGTIAYRLARHRIFNFDKDSCEARAAEDFAETVVLGMILEALEINWKAPWIQRNLGKKFGTKGPLGRRTHVDVVNELSFLLRKRHCNQETLAIVLDTLCLLDSAVREIAALTQQNAELKSRVEELVRQGCDKVSP